MDKQKSSLPVPRQRLVELMQHVKSSLVEGFVGDKGHFGTDGAPFSGCCATKCFLMRIAASVIPISNKEV